MKIILDNLVKKFNREWIIRNFSSEFVVNEPTVILGPNGSGKSTLLQLIASFTIPSEGVVNYYQNNILVEEGRRYKSIAYVAPYMELLDKLTLKETLAYHKKLKGFVNDLSVKEVIQQMDLEKHQDKFIGGFSSGMQMRVKLAMGFLSDTSVLLLDEPLSNLDSKGIDWYLSMTEKHLNDRITVVCSNEIKSEYQFCKRNIEIPHLTVR